jgi:type IV pilus assembly protein PilB
MDDPVAVFVSRGVLTEDDAVRIRAEAETRNVSLDIVLGERGFTDDDILAARQGGYAKVPTRTLGDTRVPFEILQYIPEESARHYHFVALGVDDGVLEVGLTNPDDIQALDALNFIARKAGLPFKVFHISEQDFEKVVGMYQGLTGDVGVALTELETELTEDERTIQSEINDQEKHATSANHIKEDAPIIKIVASILRYAVDGRASDIHIEMSDVGVRVRFRVDGILHTTLVLPKNTQQAIVARIKVLSSMRLDERRKPQDGRFSATISNRRIDFRVSTFPTQEGEKIVMRILDRSKGFIPMSDIGLSDRNIKLLRSAIKRPYGMILISGPTGSGKSTTLYSLMGEMDRETHNVLSLEDPVEYHMEGVSQSQVRPEIGYTFANGLRTTLRQDPDIIMVGEIRDGETAQLAIQAALTGHLVLSTIHTNDAAGVIPRLIDMGVDPYLIAPTLTLVAAQRLVQTFCPGGAKPFPMSESLRSEFEQSFSDLTPEYRPTIPAQLYEPQATPDCPSGVRGRVAAFEMFTMTPEIERVILSKSSDLDMMPLLRKQGMLTMKEDALIKAFAGQIPYSEVNTLGSALIFDEEGPSAGVTAQPTT